MPAPPPSRGRERGTRRGLRSGRPPQPAPGRVSSADNGSGSSASRTRREKNKAGGCGGAEPGDPSPPHCVSWRPPPQRSPSPSVLSPVSSDPRSPSCPHPNPGNRIPPQMHKRREEGGWRAGARSISLGCGEGMAVWDTWGPSASVRFPRAPHLAQKQQNLPPGRFLWGNRHLHGNQGRWMIWSKGPPWSSGAIENPVT